MSITVPPTPEKEQKIYKHCDYCGSLNPIEEGKCEQCGATLSLNSIYVGYSYGSYKDTTTAGGYEDTTTV